MKIFGFNFGKDKPSIEHIEQELTKTVKSMSNNFTVISMSAPELPDTKMSKKGDWIEFGKDNLYPEKLLELFYSSATHNAILDNKSKMIAGNGVSITPTSEDPKTNVLIEKFILNPTGQAGIDNDTINDILYKSALDFEIHGWCALEATWSVDFSRIASIKHVPTNKLRINDDTSQVYYSADWSNIKKNPPVSIPAFDPNNKKDYCQMIVIKNKIPGLDYYGGPDYLSCLAWLAIDAALAKYHNSNIHNSFQPGFIINYHYEPQSEEEAASIVRNLRAQYEGPQNTGRLMVFFDNGSSSPEAKPVEVSGIDDQLIALQESVVQYIISGHKVTSPLLLGIALPGKLGYSGGNDLESSYHIFQNTIINPIQTKFEILFNKIIRYWGISGSLEIKKMTESQLGVIKAIPSEVMAVLTIDEKRALAGYDPLPPIEGTPSDEQTLADKLGTNSTQNVLSVLQSSMGEPQKIQSLMILFGLDKESATALVTGIENTNQIA